MADAQQQQQQQQQQPTPPATPPVALVNTPAKEPTPGSRPRSLATLWKILPHVSWTVFRRLLGQSEASRYWSFKTEVIVAAMRALVKEPMAYAPIDGLAKIEAHQADVNRDAGVKGPVWISKYTTPVPPEAEAIRQILVDVVQQLDDPGRETLPGEEGNSQNNNKTSKNNKPKKNNKTKTQPTDNHNSSSSSSNNNNNSNSIIWPDVVPVYAEWTGYRPGVGDHATLPDGMSQAALYAALDQDATAPQRTTVLYLHGGGFFIGDPALYRRFTGELARHTAGRVYSVRYRLAPQHPFPAAVLDGLVAYLTLLYPPPGSHHRAVNAHNIVLAGDSAGGNLALAVAQVVLDLHKRRIRVPWFGTARPVPVMAGLAVNAPYLDPTSSMPAWADAPTADPAATFAAFDYLPAMGPRAPAEQGGDWPAALPRHILYADTALLTHPLVTPLVSPRARWAGAPPVYVCCGWERIAEETLFFAQTRLHNAGYGAKAVVLEHYEAMPHCFGLALPHLAASDYNLARWAAFIRRAVERPETLRSQSNSSFTYVDTTTLRTSDLDPERLSPYSEAEVQGWVRARVAALVPAKS